MSRSSPLVSVVFIKSKSIAVSIRIIRSPVPRKRRTQNEIEELNSMRTNMKSMLHHKMKIELILLPFALAEVLVVADPNPICSILFTNFQIAQTKNVCRQNV